MNTNLKMNILLIALLFLNACNPSSEVKEQKKLLSKGDTTASIKGEKIRVMFYNIENLFDTVDDPNNKGDNEYLPTSNMQWTPERYKKKLNDLKKVINVAETPDLIGFSEVENKKVVEDLAKTIGEKDWGVVHNDSPDERGIDVALLYNKKVFSVKEKDFIQVNLPEVKNDRGKLEKDFTREILYVSGKLDKETVHIFVNHWPSRRSPDEARIAAAKEVAKRTDKILAKNENDKIIIMGDFNDEPANLSIAKTLKAKNPDAVDNFEKTALYNLAYPAYRNNQGSYNYKGDINMLDHIIVSGNMLTGKNNIVTNDKYFNIVQKDFMIYEHPKYGKMANRTFGKEYYGGISDHFPIYTDIYVAK